MERVSNNKIASGVSNNVRKGGLGCKMMVGAAGSVSVYEVVLSDDIVIELSRVS